MGTLVMLLESSMTRRKQCNRLIILLACFMKLLRLGKCIATGVCKTNGVHKGKNLQREITEIVFTVSNIRDILRHGEKHPNLQLLRMEILSSLALEAEATERIGGECLRGCSTFSSGRKF